MPWRGFGFRFGLHLGLRSGSWAELGLGIGSGSKGSFLGAGPHTWTEDLVLSVHLNVLAPAREASRAPVASRGGSGVVTHDELARGLVHTHAVAGRTTALLAPALPPHRARPAITPPARRDQRRIE